MTDSNEMREFVTSLGLGEQVLTSLIINGCHSLTILKQMTQSDLKEAMGLKTAHAIVLSRALQRKKMHDDAPESSVIKLLIAQAKLKEEYVDILLSNGYDDLEFIQDASMEELMECGFKKPHAKKLTKTINSEAWQQKLKELNEASQEDTKEEEAEDFKSEEEFQEEIVKNEEARNQFIQKKVDENKPKEVKTAITLASQRAFKAEFEKVNGVIRGKGYGKVKVLAPTGNLKTTQLHGDTLFQGKAQFATDNNEQLELDVYYTKQGFNPLRQIEGEQCIFEDAKTGRKVDMYANEKDMAQKYNTMLDKASDTLTEDFLSAISPNEVSSALYHYETIPKTHVMEKARVNIAVTGPKKNCRAFFTGALVGGQKLNSRLICSKVYVVDEWSEYVGEGDYPDNKTAFPKAVRYTFDGIAVDAQTRVILYEKPNFQGKILWDKKGPAIINNMKFRDSCPEWKQNHECDYPDKELQATFPQSVREWSKSDMHGWIHGSVRVLSSGRG